MEKIQHRVKTAVILAPDEKGLLPIFGISSIRRLVMLILRIGVQRIYVIGHVNPLRPIISELLSPDSFHALEDPKLLDQVLNSLTLPGEENVLVLRANHVIDQYSLTRLIEVGKGLNLYFMEATGKRGTDGIYLSSPADIPSLTHALWSPDPSRLEILGKAQYVQGASGLPYSIDRGEDQREISEGKLVAALAFQTSERDGFFARHLDRRLSRLLSRRLAHTRVTPNQITLFGAAVGLIGAFFLSRPGYWSHLIGSLLFLFFVVMDGVDGEISRLRLQDSQFGYYLDMITDNIVNVAIFSGIAFGLYHDTADGMYLKVLLFLIGGFGLCAISVYYNILTRSEEELKHSPKVKRFMTLLTNSDFAYLIVVLALIGRLQWFLFGAAAGTYLFAAILWALSLYQKRAISR